ncbi:hypothetical protein SDC64_07505 [Acinetobacter haemolyticus]|uniref:hypothetical protein n=1 Tax=Acinetobacter haemolyticus TaxID=29430 RepID=UPI002A6B301D|nr:hypothetical protein [Acinetobacter haemolyticus]WPO68756.1 hypothetical protein SDC64_07505 [Acinetobacter haemolyticus]
MNAIQFIKDHGVEKAREVVEGAPSRANWYQVKGKYSNDLYSCNHEIYGEAIMLSELKRLVESVDRINSCGGLYGFKTYCNGDFSQEDLQAITDCEAIGGEHV